MGEGTLTSKRVIWGGRESVAYVKVTMEYATAPAPPGCPGMCSQFRRCQRILIGRRLKPISIDSVRCSEVRRRSTITLHRFTHFYLDVCDLMTAIDQASPHRIDSRHTQAGTMLFSG